MIVTCCFQSQFDNYMKKTEFITDSKKHSNLKLDEDEVLAVNATARFAICSVTCFTHLSVL
jgi:hypothetical protein